MPEVSDEVKELIKGKANLVKWVNSPMWTSSEKERMRKAIADIDEKLKRMR